MKKRFAVILFFITMGFFNLFAQPDLESYLKNDIQLKKMALEVSKVVLASDQTSIDRGIDVQLSTGSARFIVKDDSTSIDFTPAASITVPQAANLKARVSSNVTVVDGTSSTRNTKISLSADIISGNSVNRKVELMESERRVLEARRSLQNRAIEVEKSYYEQLKSLYNSAGSIISLQKDLYDDRISFEEIKAKGFSKNSAKYRQAELKVISGQHEIENKIKLLGHDCAVFASKCGTEYNEKNHPKEFLPDTIPQVEPIDILSFAKSDYIKIEKAEWAKELNTLKRKADKRFSLSANAGYTFKNSNSIISENSNWTSSKDYADTADAGLTAGWDGLSVDAGVSVPVGGNSVNPIYTLGMTVNPNKFRTAQITRKTNSLSEESENLDIEQALEDYNTEIVDRQTELNDILWAKEKIRETYEMYISLNEDMKGYLKNGIITESEYLNSFANREDYQLKVLMNQIDLLIYNNTVKLLFCRDSEISEQRGEN